MLSLQHEVPLAEVGQELAPEPGEQRQGCQRGREERSRESARALADREERAR